MKCTLYLRQCFIAGVMAASGQPVRLGERLACALAMPVSAGTCESISGRALSFAAKCAIMDECLTSADYLPLT